MISSIPRASASALLVGTILATGATAQTDFSRALPADTIAFVSFPDIKKSIEEMQNAPIARMWHEGEVQDFLADAIHLIEGKFAEAIAQGKAMHEQGHLPFNPEELMQLRLNSLSFAVTSLDLMQVDDDVMPKFGFVMHANVGESAPVWQKAFQTALGMASQNSRGKATMAASELDGMKLMTLSATDVDLPMSLNVVFRGEHMFMGTLADEVQGFAKSFGGTESRLAADLNYLKCAQRLNVQSAECEVYVRPGGMFDFLMGAMRMAKAMEDNFPEEVDIDGIERAISALGLRSITGIGSTASYMKDRCISEGFVASPKQGRRGLMNAVGDDVDMSFLRWIPKDAASLSIASIDLESIYTSFVDAIEAYDPEVAKQAFGRLGKMEEQAGISLKNDIFGAFGRRFVSWQLPTVSFTSAPELAYILEVKNQAGLMNALRKAADMSDGLFEIEENERRGIKVYQILVDFDFAGAGGINPFAAFTPTFAFNDGYIVGAFQTGDIRRAFKRMEREDDPTGDIRSNAEFLPYLQQIPRSGVKSLSFTDWKTTFESYYQMGTMGLALFPFDSDEIPIDLSLLPDSQTLTQHLCGSVTWSQVSDDGFSTTAIGPWGPETVALVGAAIAGGAAGFVAIRGSDW